ncbi:MAG: hypothetical protein HUU20_06155 [Pirellulales bacterium]|nr:hypothetical protein [Pirellulales bacterium]
MAITWFVVFGLLLMPLLGLVLSGVVVLSNERFRAVVKALLAVPLVVVLAFGVLAAWRKSVVVPDGSEVAVVDRSEIAIAPSPDGTRHQVNRPAVVSENPAPPSATESAGPKDGDVQRLFRALSRALLKTMADSNPSEVPHAVEKVSEKSAIAGPILAERMPQPGQPDWVDAAPQQVGGGYRMAVSVGPYATRGECDRELPRALCAAVDEYVGQYLGPEAAGRVELPSDYVQQNVVQQEWLETRQVSVSPTKQIPMVRLHVLLEFDREVNNRIDEAWRQAVVHRKLWTLGSAGTVLLLLLSTFWAYLKTDLATAGAYRGRLRFATGLAVALVVLAGLAALG